MEVMVVLQDIMTYFTNDVAQHAAEVILSAAMRQACNRISASVSLRQFLCSLDEGDGDATGHPEMHRE